MKISGGYKRLVRSRGVALISILIISVTLLAVLTVGLKMGSDGVLFVSQAHKRNVALSAAEAGVYEAMRRLDTDKLFAGAANGTLSESGANYQITVTNELSTSGTATVISTGRFGGVKRTLKAQLRPDASAYQAVSLAGKVYVFDEAYINGIASTANPLVRPGNGHTQYNGSDYAFVGRDYNEDGTHPSLVVTGDLTTAGNFDPGLTAKADTKTWGVSKPPYRLDRTSMLSGSFTSSSTVSPGTMSHNVKVNGDLTVTGKLIVPKDVTLYVTGNADFLAGLSGDGQVVVDGDVVVKTDAVFDPTVLEGIKLVADGSVIIGHPTAQVDEDDITINFDPVGDFFARMPMDAPSELSNGLPTDAPPGTAFLNWFNTKAGMSNPGNQFDMWYNGDGSEVHPGLSPSTKQWLQESRTAEVQTWASIN